MQILAKFLSTVLPQNNVVVRLHITGMIRSLTEKQKNLKYCYKTNMAGWGGLEGKYPTYSLRFYSFQKEVGLAEKKQT